MSDLRKIKHQVRRVVGISRRTEYALKSRFSVGRDFIFNIDSPTKRLQDKRLVSVEGWVISKKDKNFTPFGP